MTYTPLDYTGLLEPQKPHALKLLDSLYLNGVASDTSDTGCGKTYVASWIAKQTGLPIVVICPKSVIPVWKKIFSSFGVTAHLFINWEKIVRGGTQHLWYRAENEMINPKTGNKEIVGRYMRIKLDFPAGSLVILDESHKCRGVTSLSSGLLIAIKRQGYKVLTLSATQATSPTEMKSYGYVANLHDLYSWKSWCLDHGAEESTHRDELVFDSENKESQNKMKRCHNNLFNFQGIASRLTKSDMGTLFPDNHIIAESYDLCGNNPKIQSVYDEMEDEIAKLDEQTENYSGHIFAEIMKARRKVELYKLPFFLESIYDLLEDKKSIVCFLNFTDSIQYLSDELTNKNLTHSIIVGGQSDIIRQRNINLFQSDVNRINLCNIKSGGYSISLHDLNGKYPRHSIISPTWSAIDLLQCLGRIHRVNGKTPCLQRLVYADGTIENRMCHRIQTRLNNLSCLNDGDLSELNFV